MGKYIFVTGGVCSGLGKGISSASIGNLLESKGISIRLLKIDPYINVDAGTMNPYQHGEVFVTDDGAETDLDMGNYERFTSATLSRENSITTGQVYQEVIRREREGKYLGRTVQVIPHITDEIKKRIFNIGEQEGVDLTIVEVGGTVGDIESIPFLEAARQFIHDLGREAVLFIHLTMVPSVADGELKTKPTQHSVRSLREIGIQPDILICRAEIPLNSSLKRKISLYTNVEEEAVISAYDVPVTIYEIPLIFAEQNLDTIVINKLKLKSSPGDLSAWTRMVEIYCNAKRTVKIGIVGKYTDLLDSYKSIYEALYHGGIANKVKIELVKIDSDEIAGMPAEDSDLTGVAGILIPGGFGYRGIEGMIAAANYARIQGLPCFGICLGMQVMVIEYARNVLALAEANSTEFNQETEYPVISLLAEQVDIKTFGATMRLGRSESRLEEGTLINSAYGRKIIYERHRHRYEVSSIFKEALNQAGLILSGFTADSLLVESVEWSEHPWGLGVQFHPEFKSKPIAPHPLFSSFISACINRNE